MSVVRLYDVSGARRDVGVEHDQQQDLWVQQQLGVPDDCVIERKVLRCVQVRDGATTTAIVAFDGEAVPWGDRQNAPANPAAPMTMRGSILVYVEVCKDSAKKIVDYTYMFDPSDLDRLVQLWDEKERTESIHLVWNIDNLNMRMDAVPNKELS
jgi:hypothetical protein